jgi:hypothetical protein
LSYNPDMTISEVLAERLKQDGTTHEAAALALETTQPTVTRWVLGHNAPGPTKVPLLAAFTGLTEDQVAAAIHRQRVRLTLIDRVAALEEQLAQVLEVLEQIQASSRPKR